MAVDLAQVIPPLVEAKIDFILIDGMAAILHGSARVTFGVRFKCVDLPTLIRIKEAAGRKKDHEAIAELRVLLEESEKKRS